MSVTKHRFLSDERGTVTVETLIILPIVIWAFVATFVFFDAYRVNTTSQKAAYTVADALSRQTEPVGQEFIEGMNQLHDILASTRNPTTIRVSSIGWDQANSRYVAIWSIPTGEREPLTAEDLEGPMQDRLPSFPEGETIILVETAVDYVPAFDVGITAQTYNQAIVTRPRFAPQVAFDDGTQLLFQNFGPATCDDGGELCS